MKTQIKLLFTLLLFVQMGVVNGAESFEVKLDVASEINPISPYLYGRNNATSQYPDKPTTEEDWTRILESGVTFLRENFGNESSKYHYKRHLTSAPDFYNDVRVQDWDYELATIQERIPHIQAMFGMQMIGYAAKTTEWNFPYWQWYLDHNKVYLHTGQNVTGKGAQPNPEGGKYALVEGDINSYLEEWPVDSAIGLLDHWFGPDGLGFDRSKVQYWAMDNEPDIWHTTHDDVRKEPFEPEEFMQIYFKTAKLMRVKYPDLKLVGPITCNEWQWYTAPNHKGVTLDGKHYTWLEFFIKRVAEEEKATGIKLLDVFSIHFYPGEMADNDVLQTHRLFFDENYDYPKANGIKRINGVWDTTQTKEYIFKRCRDWMLKYFGEVRDLGMTEIGIESKNPNILAVWYASMMGEFIRNDVKLFTPWYWELGMWETLHLFARYNKSHYLAPISSSNDSILSAYPTISEDKDSLSIVWVNRSLTENRKVVLDVANFAIEDGDYTMMQLANLPQEETFFTHSINALKEVSVTIKSNKAEIDLPPLSVSTLNIDNRIGTKLSDEDNAPAFSLYPTSTDGILNLSRLNEKILLQIVSPEGKVLYSQKITEESLQLNVSFLAKGYYLCAISDGVVTHTLPFLKR